MANVWFCSDLHLGQRNIAKYRGLTEEDQYELLYKEWHSKVTKRDIVYVLGDCCFSKERLADFSKWRGEKRLILGNHDTEHATIKELAEVFTEIHSLRKYKNFWLSHAPLHPDELRGRINIHGHTHYHVINDKRYINICLEQTGYKLIDIAALKALAEM